MKAGVVRQIVQMEDQMERVGLSHVKDLVVQQRMVGAAQVVQALSIGARLNPLEHSK